jgi:hypothetical protein
VCRRSSAPRSPPADTLALLFSGKLDLFAVPALGELRARGLVRPARFLPPWALDPGWVLSYLTLNTFIGRIDLTAVGAAMADILDHCPRVDIQMPDVSGEVVGT